MKRKFRKSMLPTLCLLAIASRAFAEPAAPDSTMSFIASPAVAVNGYPSYPHIVQVRNSDVTNVILHQPAACGERLADASYKLEGKFLLLRYSAPYKGLSNRECVSTGMFVFHGLPPGDIQVIALPDALPVAPAAALNETSNLQMGFLAAPAIAVTGYAAYPDVVRVRNGDTANVIVHQPTACGERLRDATFELEGDFLLLRYSAPYGVDGNSGCVSTSMYTFRGLPARDIQVVALPEPVPVAAASAVPSETSALRMGFLASPAIAVPGYAAYPDVLQVRNGDTANVIVHQPAACGERLRDATFELEDNWLLLRYSAPYKGDWNSECVSTGMFVFHGLPTGNIQIVAVPEPVSTASMAARN